RVPAAGQDAGARGPHLRQRPQAGEAVQAVPGALLAVHRWRRHPRRPAAVGLPRRVAPGDRPAARQGAATAGRRVTPAPRRNICGIRTDGSAVYHGSAGVRLPHSRRYPTMLRATLVSVALAGAALACTPAGDELKSTFKPGDPVNAFSPYNVNGAAAGKARCQV